MFHTIKRILDIAGDQKKYIYAGIVCNILKTFSMAMMLMASFPSALRSPQMISTEELTRSILTISMAAGLA